MPGQARLRSAGVVVGESEAEIGDPGSHPVPGAVSLAVQEDVGGLEVEMEQAAAVEVPDRAGDRLHQPGRHARRKGFRQSLLEGAAGDVFEHQEEPPVRLAVIIERDDVGVPDARYRTRLAQPAAAWASARVRPRGSRKDLQGDQTIQARLDRQVDHAHAHPGPARTGSRNPGCAAIAPGQARRLWDRGADGRAAPGPPYIPGSPRHAARWRRTSHHRAHRCRASVGSPPQGRTTWLPALPDRTTIKSRPPSGPRRACLRRGASGPPAPWRRTPRYGSSPGPWRSSRRSSRRRRPARTHPTCGA